MNDHQRKKMLTVKIFLSIAITTGRNFIEGGTFAVLNTAFSAREANYSDEIFAKHYVTKFTCTRAENVEIWRQIQVTMGIISNSFSFNREINLSLDTKYLKVQRLGIYCFAPR